MSTFSKKKKTAGLPAKGRRYVSPSPEEDCIDNFAISDFEEDDEEITQICNDMEEELTFRRRRSISAEAEFFGLAPPTARTRSVSTEVNGVRTPSPLPRVTNFRVQAKKFFLTWPRTTGNPDDLLAQVLLYRKPVRKCIVAVEQHKDGMDHIHVFVEYFKKLDIKNCNYFDKMFLRPNGTHPHCNISSVKDLSATLRYITKGGNYHLYGITKKMIDLIIDGTSISLAEVTAAVLESPRIEDIAIRFPNKFVIHSKGLRALCEIQRQKLSFQTIPYQWPGLLRSNPVITNIAAIGENSSLLTWLRYNFETCVQEGTNKPRKSSQLYLHGPTGTGKTYVLDFLRKHYRGFGISSFEDFYDRYNDYDYDFLYLDEFHGNKKIFWLNTLLAGEPMVIARKGSQYPRLVNNPVVICSNMTPEQCYPKVARERPKVLDAFLARLQIVQLTYAAPCFDLIDQLEACNAFVPLAESDPESDSE